MTGLQGGMKTDLNWQVDLLLSVLFTKTPRSWIGSNQSSAHFLPKFDVPVGEV